MTHYTKGTPSPLRIRRSTEAPTACRRPVSGTVSLPSSGCFSPFPHGTGSLSVSKEYLAFEGGPPIFRQDFTCPALLDTSIRASHTGLSPAMAPLPRGFWSRFSLGWSPFARHYWGSLILMSFPPGTEMFQFPGFASCDLCIQSQDTWLAPSLTSPKGRQRQSFRWVAPFGDLWIKAYSRLPKAYRRVSRPSSPLAAKASTKRPSRA
jgi:hypothetical protein